jgi:hypothetical protein
MIGVSMADILGMEVEIPFSSLPSHKISISIYLFIWQRKLHGFGKI